MALRVWRSHQQSRSRPTPWWQPPNQAPELPNVKGSRLRQLTVRQSDADHQRLMQQLVALSSQLTGIVSTMHDIADIASQSMAAANKLQAPKARTVRIVSDSSKSGHAVYSFDLEPYPYIFIRQISATQWLELQRDTTHLEARAVTLALEHALSDRQLRRTFAGADIIWVSDNQALVSLLSSGPRRLPSSASARKIECHRIFQVIALLDIKVHWVWLSRDKPAIRLADQLSRMTTERITSADVMTTSNLGVAGTSLGRSRKGSGQCSSSNSISKLTAMLVLVGTATQALPILRSLAKLRMS